MSGLWFVRRWLCLVWFGLVWLERYKGYKDEGEGGFIAKFVIMGYIVLPLGQSFLFLVLHYYTARRDGFFFFVTGPLAWI